MRLLPIFMPGYGWGKGCPGLWGTVMERKILQGWKEIEDYIGLDRETIIAQGYPARQIDEGGGVCAVSDELLAWATSLPLVKKVREARAKMQNRQ